MKHFSKYIYQLFKAAAVDIPGFYPEWVKKHPKLEQFKTLTEIKKNIPIADYREPVSVRFDLLIDINKEKKILIDSFCQEIVSVLNSFKNNCERDMDENPKKYGPFSEFLSQVIDSIDPEYMFERFKTSDKLSQVLVVKTSSKISIPIDPPAHLKLEDKSKTFTKTINIPADTSLITVGSLLADSYDKYVSDDRIFTDSLRDITTFAGFKKLSYIVSDKFKKDVENKSKENFEIVFSTKPSDLLSMSIRADWSSCQNLLAPKDRLNVKAINSTISPNVGIIYLTNKKDYASRGEEMVGRALVFLLNKTEYEDEYGFGIDEDEDDMASEFLKKMQATKSDQVINISKIYSNFDKEYIMNLFENSLKKHSKLPVKLSAEGYYFPSAEVEAEEAHPYFDDPEMKVKVPPSHNR